MLRAPNLSQFEWLTHGFGQRDSDYPEGIATPQQIHSEIVLEAGCGSGDRFAAGDALVAAEPGVTVGIRTADCVPILLVDTRRRAVAAAHAGWRGTAQQIAVRTVEQMRRLYGSRPEDLRAAVGPSIGACCYEVGPEVALQFDTGSPDSGSAGGGPVRIDLPAINAAQLRAAGLQDIWIARECTFCLSDRYFSFRREKEQAGRMVSFVGVRGKHERQAIR
ncbi:MAG: peptidoglycan editing factor PgeF [Acidobacteriota bacterium]|nr:peptidoglycan editing factor PgeF [Acidobacteriota bacterium]